MYRQELFDASRRVFEEAAFAIVDYPENSTAPAWTENNGFIAASVAFSGPISGTVALATTESVALTAASNMLGLEENDHEASEESLDALCELLNMITGNLLPFIAGVKPEFRISPPACVSFEEYRRMKDTHQGDVDTQSILVEGCPTEIALFLNAPECVAP